MSFTSFSFRRTICSFVSSSSASGTVGLSTSSRSSGIAWHILNSPTNTSSWRWFCMS